MGLLLDTVTSVPITSKGMRWTQGRERGEGTIRKQRHLKVERYTCPGLGWLTLAG